MEATDFAADPILQFDRWFSAAQEQEATDATAMALATATPAGAPAVRMVLLKAVDQRGFVFFTNYEGRKARELDANPSAALLFYWASMQRQVRVEGIVARIPPQESDAYHAERSRQSQLGAWASPQSRPIPEAAWLRTELEAMRRRFAEAPVPRPPHWGGYNLAPRAIEFWQSGEHRLHDRFRYERSGESWQMQRLAP